MSQQHGYNTRNIVATYPKSADQERNGAEKKYYKAINDWK